MKKRTAGLVATTLLLMAASLGYAEEFKGWRTEITPNAWFAGIEGEITVKGHKAEFEKSVGDLLDYVEFAAAISDVVLYDRLVFRGQFDYFALSTDALDVEDQPAGGKLDTDMYLTEVGAGYRLDGWADGQTFDLMLGMRFLHSKNDLEVYNVGSFSKKSDLVDPMLFVRGSIPILPSRITGLRFVGVAGIGAAAGDSEMAYELQPQLEYRFNDTIAARLGYRRVGWNVESEANQDELDFAMAGLNVGVALTF